MSLGLNELIQTSKAIVLRLHSVKSYFVMHVLSFLAFFLNNPYTISDLVTCMNMIEIFLSLFSFYVHIKYFQVYLYL